MTRWDILAKLLEMITLDWYRRYYVCSLASQTPPPSPHVGGGERSLVSRLTSTRARQPETRVPIRFQYLGHMQLSPTLSAQTWL
jgi:hypothetical protein